MRPDPKPVKCIVVFESQRAPMLPNSDRMQWISLADKLEVQASLIRIVLPLSKSHSGLLLDIKRQLVKMLAKISGDARIHRILSRGNTSPRAISPLARATNTSRPSSGSSACCSSISSSISQEATLSCLVSGSLETSAIAFFQ